MVERGGSADSADWRVFEERALPPILASTLDAFEEHGYHGTTVRDIARRVGMTVPAIYYHYENKQALLVELLMSSMSSLLERCRAALREAGDEPVTRFSTLVECIVLYMSHRGSQGLLDSEIRSLEPVNRARYVALRDELESILHGIVADGVRDGVFRSEYPVDAGRAVLTMCHAVARWYHPGGPLSEEELARRYVVLSLDMLACRAPAKRRQLARLNQDAVAPAKRDTAGQVVRSR